MMVACPRCGFRVLRERLENHQTRATCVIAGFKAKVSRSEYVQIPDDASAYELANNVAQDLLWLGEPILTGPIRFEGQTDLGEAYTYADFWPLWVHYVNQNTASIRDEVTFRVERIRRLVIDGSALAHYKKRCRQLRKMGRGWVGIYRLDPYARMLD